MHFSNRDNPTSCYSSELNRRDANSPYRYRLLPRRPLNVDLQLQSHRSNIELASPSKIPWPGVFSYDKVIPGRGQEQSGAKERAKHASFSIKKMLDRSVSMRKERSKERVESKQKQKYDLRIFWRRYLEPEQDLGNGIRHLQDITKDMGMVVNRSKNKVDSGRDKITTGESSNILVGEGNKTKPIQPRLLNPEQMLKMDQITDKKNKSHFYATNFIKTRFRKQKHHQPESIKTEKKRNVREQTFEKNWVVPWDKVHDTQEDNFAT